MAQEAEVGGLAMDEAKGLGKEMREGEEGMKGRRQAVCE
jgi:hypothetical protein